MVMAKLNVNVQSITVLNNPAMFCSPLQLEICYHSSAPLPYDLEWKLVYIGCADDDRYDQVLDTVRVGPVQDGNFKFLLQADPPNADWIPEEDILGVAAIILTCCYRGHEFFRVGYYVSNQYILPELIRSPPSSVLVDQIQRLVLASVPRISTSPASFLSLDLHKHDDYGLLLEEEQLEHEYEYEQSDMDFWELFLLQV